MSRGVIALALATAGLAFGAAPASADDFFVNSSGDVADQTLDGTCLTVGALCTLRAAMQEANNETDNPGADTITLSAVVFTGAGAASVIDIGATPLPAITAPVSIACQTEPATTPCGQVDSPPAGNNVFTVNADSVSIRGLSITNALQGIGAFEDDATSLTGFALKHSWIGITLAGTAGSHNTGVFLDDTVSGATFGDGTAVGRNVFGNLNIAAINITGADDSVIQGNYFGVLPDGSTQAANVFDIKVGGNANNNDPADDTVIGGELSPTQEGTAECDGPCNVISGATADGVDLAAAAAPFLHVPAGPTAIQGNYIGLNHDASAAVANAGAGVDVGGAGGTGAVDVGSTSSPFGNYITGGTVGVSATAGANFQVFTNRIGVRFDQTQALAPPQVGVDVVAPAGGSVNANRIVTSVGDAVHVQGGTDVEVDENLVGLGAGGQNLGVGGDGIHLVSATTPSLEDNTVVGAAGDGVVIEDTDDAELTGNAFGLLSLGNAGAGMRISGGSTGTLVGSDNPSLFNDMSGNAGPAVAIAGATTDDNEVLGNTGSGNASFIDLAGDGANNNIAPPDITAVEAASASGIAEPGATVRLFEKSSSAAGEIADLIDTAVADGSGNWSVSYGSAPDFVGATQTVAGDGTSELAVAGSGTGDVAPETTITKKPKKKSTKRKAKFKFESSEAGSTFECKLDKKPFKPCTSPFKKKVKPKKHKFLVRAIDAAGNVDPTPAKAKFKVLKPD